MKTPATIKGHPFQPILVTFPIALWVFSLASDIIAFAGLGRTEVWEPVAFYTMAGGIAGALPAALPGLVDLLSTQDPRVKRIGVVHFLARIGECGLPTPLGRPVRSSSRLLAWR